MNRTHARITLVLAIALSVTALAQTSRAASPAAPAPTGPTKIGLIDIETAVAASNEGRRDFENLQKRFDPKNVELKTRNDEVEGLKKQLQAQGDKMNDEARAALARQIEQKQTALKRFVEDTQAEIQGQSKELFTNIANKMMKSLDKWATANGYTLVINISTLPQNTVLWAAPTSGVDITKDVVDAYNADSGVPAPATAARPPAPKPATPTPAKPR
jgi:Skp family chaperone for outer membrane proteins